MEKYFTEFNENGSELIRLEELEGSIISTMDDLDEAIKELNRIQREYDKLSSLDLHNIFEKITLYKKSCEDAL